MTETRSFLCVSCPVGCPMKVELKDGVFAGVSGNKCPRGETYARSEISNPLRLFTSTVKVNGGALPVCPVRSKDPVPLDLVLDIARCLAGAVVDAPIEIGQSVLQDVCGTGVDIVATRSLPK